MFMNVQAFDLLLFRNSQLFILLQKIEYCERSGNRKNSNCTHSDELNKQLFKTCQTSKNAYRKGTPDSTGEMNRNCTNRIVKFDFFQEGY